MLVKAAPVLTSNLDETMCVAGARLDAGPPTWVRLHPVPFRDLASESRFVKYQEVEVELTSPRSDRRPESWTPISGSITLGAKMSPERAWADRRSLVGQLHAATMCDLVEANRTGSGPGTPSLAVVHPAEPPELLIATRDDEQLTKWRTRAEGAKRRMSLFDDPDASKPDFEVVPWRFSYRYHCHRRGCNGHEQTIVDWEAVALWRRVRHRRDWQDLMRQKFEQVMWSGRAASLFVGNQEQHPASFLVLGVFWPPDTHYQPRMLE
ncbi:MAG TPA: hypothetical protein VF228_16140 [Iamia sp.]